MRSNLLRSPSSSHARKTPEAICSLMLLGLGMGLAPPVTGMAEGFIDDTKATLNLRNVINRNYTNPDYPQSKAGEEWTQNFILDVKSGLPKARSVSG